MLNFLLPALPSIIGGAAGGLSNFFGSGGGGGGGGSAPANQAAGGGNPTNPPSGEELFWDKYKGWIIGVGVVVVGGIVYLLTKVKPKW